MGVVILLLIFNGLVINGVWFVTSPGELLSLVGRFFETKTPQWVAKPTVQCRKCMSSVWGSAVYLLIGHHDLGLPLSWWVPYCLALCGMITFFSSIHE